MVLEDKSSPYDTDVFADVFKILQESEPKREDKEKNTERLKELQATPDARIFVDHMRTSLLLIYSGVVPSNT
jgi:alanyl-tRNA synthetase